MSMLSTHFNVEFISKTKFCFKTALHWLQLNHILGMYIGGFAFLVAVIMLLKESQMIEKKI